MFFEASRSESFSLLSGSPVMLPETEMHTVAAWWTLPDSVTERYGKDDLQNGMLGVANLLRIAAPLLLMCSPHDIVVTYQVKCTFTNKPTLILYDNCPGGVGISEKAFHMRSALFDSARTIVRDCDCENGCPSCAGPVAEIGENGKRLSGELLDILCKMTEED